MSIPPASRNPPVWRPRRVQAGSWTITALSDGWLRLDGGSMWGVVPKALWNAWTPAEDDNTILLALRPFLAERGDVRVLVEPGVGDRWSPKLARIYGLVRKPTLRDSLHAAGIAPESITHVIGTHAHWDHVGAWVEEREGRLGPVFPRVKHYLPRIELAVARDADAVRRASYRAEDVEPIESAGILTTLEGSTEIVPGLRVHVLGGHSDGVAVVTWDEERDDGAIFWSDVVPTAHHVQPPYIMAYDLDVARSHAVRSEWLARAAERGWTGCFYHDVDNPFGRLRREGSRYAVELIEGQ
ncbi:MAG: MBL fold metallo-hydrolase [Planctomycetota bacterium]|nr:MBL fold metallo-hydrolase [Planctomycetota bacterium]